jgi:hypothetical protein
METLIKTLAVIFIGTGFVWFFFNGLFIRTFNLFPYLKWIRLGQIVLFTLIVLLVFLSVLI